MFDLNFKDFSKESTAKRGGGGGGLILSVEKTEKRLHRYRQNSGLILENFHKVNKIKQKMLVQNPLLPKYKPSFNSRCSRKVPWCNG